MKKITQIEITNALTTFIANDGIVQKCKPKLAPKKRTSNITIPTKAYINYCLGNSNQPSNKFLNKYFN